MKRCGFLPETRIKTLEMAKKNVVNHSYMTIDSAIGHKCGSVSIMQSCDHGKKMQHYAMARSILWVEKCLF